MADHCNSGDLGIYYQLKLNPVIGLIFGSLIMGIGCNLGLVETVSNIGTGFGNLLAGIGLPIGLGVILGKLLEESGGARIIAETLVKKAGENMRYMPLDSPRSFWQYQYSLILHLSFLYHLRLK